MAPSTPPPPNNELLAALTMASTRSVVMFAWMARRMADMFSSVAPTTCRWHYRCLCVHKKSLPIRPSAAGIGSLQCAHDATRLDVVHWPGAVVGHALPAHPHRRGA